eukprot:COSAG06_NODE_1727_length_8571_cov_31.340770_2_plen_701_part_00
MQGELQSLTNKELKERAAAAGISAQKIEAARDEEEPKPALIALIVAHHEDAASKAKAQHDKLQSLTNKELKERAAAAGISAQKIEAARDEEEPKPALIALILSAEADAPTTAAGKAKKKAMKVKDIVSELFLPFQDTISDWNMTLKYLAAGEQNWFMVSFGIQVFSSVIVGVFLSLYLSGVKGPLVNQYTKKNPDGTGSDWGPCLGVLSLPVGILLGGIGAPILGVVALVKDNDDLRTQGLKQLLGLQLVTETLPQLILQLYIGIAYGLLDFSLLWSVSSSLFDAGNTYVLIQSMVLARQHTYRKWDSFRATHTLYRAAQTAVLVLWSALAVGVWKNAALYVVVPTLFVAYVGSGWFEDRRADRLGSPWRAGIAVSTVVAITLACAMLLYQSTALTHDTEVDAKWGSGISGKFILDHLGSSARESSIEQPRWAAAERLHGATSGRCDEPYGCSGHPNHGYAWWVVKQLPNDYLREGAIPCKGVSSARQITKRSNGYGDADNAWATGVSSDDVRSICERVGGSFDQTSEECVKQAEVITGLTCYEYCDDDACGSCSGIGPSEECECSLAVECGAWTDPLVTERCGLPGSGNSFQEGNTCERIFWNERTGQFLPNLPTAITRETPGRDSCVYQFTCNEVCAHKTCNTSPHLNLRYGRSGAFVAAWAAIAVYVILAMCKIVLDPKGTCSCNGNDKVDILPHSA